MTINFKTALEELKFLKTPEGKADSFLRTTIKKLGESPIAIESIESLYFEIYGSGFREDPSDYKLFAYCKHTTNGMARTQTICFSSPFGDKEEIFLVYNALKNILGKSYKLEETLANFGGNEFFHFVQGFHFKI